MEQTTTSAAFPNQLENITRKVAKMLTHKYSIEDHTLTSQHASPQQQRHRLPSDLRPTPEDVIDRTEKMNTKLKLIRTMLGYEHESSQRRQKAREEAEERQEERTPNLKQFVMSMRKRNELTDKYFRPRRTSQPDESANAFDPESKNIQEYTDASLKYVHSFLPHHTTLEHSDSRPKKPLELTLTPHCDKQPPSPTHNTIETLQRTPPSITLRPEITASVEKRRPYPLKNKRSLTISNPNHSSISSKRSVTYFPEPRREEASQLTTIERKEGVNLPTIQIESPSQQREFKLISSSSPMEVYAHRVTELIYRGKNYNKQLKTHMRHQRESERVVGAPQRPERKGREGREGREELLPVIKPCVPESRPRAAHAH